MAKKDFERSRRGAHANGAYPVRRAEPSKWGIGATE
jgi:hypothetical protein